MMLLAWAILLAPGAELTPGAARGERPYFRIMRRAGLVRRPSAGTSTPRR